MATRNRIPVKLGEFDPYIRNTADYLTTGSNASRLGITNTEKTAWDTRSGEWSVKYALYTNLDTRTKSVTDTIKNMRTSFNAFAKPLLDRIAVSPNIIPADRNVFNIPARDTNPSPRGKITDVPFVEFISLEGGRIQVRARTSEDASRASIPKIADGIEIKFLIDNTPPANVKATTDSVISKKAIFFYETDGTVAGKRFYAYARYVNLSNPANNGAFSGLQNVVIQG